MRIVIESDHAGFEYKNLVLAEIEKAGYPVKDLGTFDPSKADDYPDHAQAVAEIILSGRADRGVIICGSGIGVSVAANKFRGIRAGVCHDGYSAHQCVEHDDVNVLCIGQRVIGIELAKEVVGNFLGAVYSHEARHQRRLDKIKAIESRNMK